MSHTIAKIEPHIVERFKDHRIPRLFNLNEESPEYIAAYDLESAIEFHCRLST